MYGKQYTIPLTQPNVVNLVSRVSSNLPSISNPPLISRNVASVTSIPNITNSVGSLTSIPIIQTLPILPSTMPFSNNDCSNEISFVPDNSFINSYSNLLQNEYANYQVLNQDPVSLATKVDNKIKRNRKLMKKFINAATVLMKQIDENTNSKSTANNNSNYNSIRNLPKNNSNNPTYNSGDKSFLNEENEFEHFYRNANGQNRELVRRRDDNYIVESGIQNSDRENETKAKVNYRHKFENENEDGEEYQNERDNNRYINQQNNSRSSAFRSPQ